MAAAGKAMADGDPGQRMLTPYGRLMWWRKTRVWAKLISEAGREGSEAARKPPELASGGRAGLCRFRLSAGLRSSIGGNKKEASGPFELNGQDIRTEFCRNWGAGDAEFALPARLGASIIRWRKVPGN